MTDLYEALAEVPGSCVLRGPRGIAVQVSPSMSKKGGFIIMVFAPNEEDVVTVIDNIHGCCTCLGFIPPVRCADGFYRSMGRVK